MESDYMPFDNKYTLDDYNKAIELHNEGLGSLRISKILGYKTRSAIEDWINKDRKPYYFSEKRIAACNSKENVERMIAMNKITQPKAVKISAELRIKRLPKNSRVINEDLSYMLGVLYGDGHISVNQRRVMLSVTDKDFAIKFKETLENWSGFKARFVTRQIKLPFYIKSRKLQYLTYIDSKEASEFLHNFDIKELKYSKINMKCAFLKGFFDSEGSANNVNLKQGFGLSCCNINYGLIIFIKNLLASVSIDSKLRLGVTSKIGDSHGGNPFYTLIIRNKQSIINFYSLIGFSINRKQQRLLDQVNYITKLEATKMGSDKNGGSEEHTVFIGSKPFMKGSQ